MKIKEIYDLAVQSGIEKDPRGRAEVQKILEQNKKEYEDLKEKNKVEYDQDKFFNPYADSRVLYGDLDKEVKRVLVGIDMEVGEVLLADRLKEKGQNIDLIISHHPEGKALAALAEVMHMQEDILALNGVPINIAQGIMAERINEVRRNLLPLNHNRAVDVAKMLDIPLMSIHTPADNNVVTFLQNIMDERKPDTVGDVVNILKEIPEYAEAVKHNTGPRVVVGNPKRKAGKVFVEMTGGTGGSENAFEKMAHAGVGTLVMMHIGEKHRKEAEKHHINVIIAGHLASDSIGMNLILDEMAKRGIEIVPCSGLIRVAR